MCLLADGTKTRGQRTDVFANRYSRDMRKLILLNDEDPEAQMINNCKRKLDRYLRDANLRDHENEKEQWV